MKNKFLILLVFCLISCSKKNQEKQPVFLFKEKEMISFKCDTSIRGIIIKKHYGKNILYRVSYFDKIGKNRYDVFHEHELIKK